MRIRNKNGNLSSHGLACGYVQAAGNHYQKAELWQDGGVFFVKLQTHGEMTTQMVFDLLPEARKQFKDWCKRYALHSYNELWVAK